MVPETTPKGQQMMYGQKVSQAANVEQTKPDKSHYGPALVLLIIVLVAAAIMIAISLIFFR